jgi:hypothetical protein
MRTMRPALLATVLAAASLALALGSAPPASASFGFLPGSAGFDAAATNFDGSTAKQAGGHPYEVRIALAMNQAGSLPDGDLRDLSLALPPGLLANSAAAEQCNQAQFNTPRTSPFQPSLSGESCPVASQVGLITVHTSEGTRSFGLFNLIPRYGAPVSIGASPFGVPIVFNARVRQADAALIFELRNLSQGISVTGMELTLWGVPPGSPSPPKEISTSPRVLESVFERDNERVNCLNEEDPSKPFGEPGRIISIESSGKLESTYIPGTCSPPAAQAKAYLTLPSSCAAPLEWRVSARSWQQPGATALADAQTPPVSGCVEPLSKAKVQLRTELASSPTGLVFNIDINDGGGFLNEGGNVRSPIQKAMVALPEGLTINPSVGSGLGVCSEVELARESASSAPGVGCPNASKIGEVEIEGLLGLLEPVKGSLFLAQPYENPTGSLLALYIVAADPRHGLFEKAIGTIEPDPRTGRLVATFEGLPQLHYTHFDLSLREGQRAVLLSPPACGNHITQLELRPYSDPTEVIHDASTLRITQGEGGGPCPSGAVRSFHPGLLAGSLNSQAGAYSPFHLRMTRTDSEQEITSYSATFPPGLLGRIAGLPYCSEAAIAAAKVRTGREELEAPSCPAASSIGHTLAGYGVGQVLAWAPGALYLGGPYHGAPLSVVAIDSALVGPFDLGVVVVRSAIRIDRRTAQASIDSSASDPIPHILKGIPLHLRDIRVYVDRPAFTVNPTSCDPLTALSTLTGAGNDVYSGADDTAATSSDRFQLLNCSALGFKPRFSLSLKGGHKRGDNPALKAVVRPRPGNANIAKAVVTLPPKLFLAQEHLDTLCTQRQFAIHACPKGSVYGYARAITPLLDEPMSGPVYLRSNGDERALPDLVAAIEGRGFEVDVLGKVDSYKGGLRGTFDVLPDAPVTKFTMTLFGGKRGIIANATNVCANPQTATAKFVGANNATQALRTAIRVRCGKGKGKDRHQRGGKR